MWGQALRARSRFLGAVALLRLPLGIAHLTPPKCASQGRTKTRNPLWIQRGYGQSQLIRLMLSHGVGDQLT